MLVIAIAAYQNLNNFFIFSVIIITKYRIRNYSSEIRLLNLPLLIINLKPKNVVPIISYCCFQLILTKIF